MNKSLLISVLVLFFIKATAQTTRVEAENYISMAGVGTENAGDVGGGLNVGWIDQNDWLEYNINPGTSGTYNMRFRTAGPIPDARFQISINGVSVTTVNLSPSSSQGAAGGWQDWITSPDITISLNSGPQTIKFLSTNNSGWNINWFEFTLASSQPPPPPPPPPPPSTATGGWALAGNAGITETTDFIGTTDAKSLAIRTNNLERMKFHANGNVGIGITTPQVKLHVSSTSGETFRLESTVSPYSAYYNGNTGSRIGWSGFGLGLSDYELSNESTGSIVFRTSSGGVAPLNIPRMTITNQGNVGIGNAAPYYQLSLGSNSKGLNEYSSTATGLDAIKVVSDNVGSNFGTQNLNVNGYSGVEYLDNNNNVKTFMGYKNGGTGEFRINNVASNGFIVFKIGHSDKLIISNSGNIGIGTSDPQSKLAVNGDITSKKIKVTQSGWPDYVFEPNYKLPTLKEVEGIYKKNKHLPQVMSAKEVEEKGLDLGDNQAALLKKIEELTLYVIEQNKKLEAQAKRIETLESKSKK